MINRKEFFRAGTIKKTFGVEGEMIFLFHKETEINLKQKEPIFPEIDGNLVPFFIQKLQWHNSRELRVKLEDIDSIDTATGLTGLPFYLPLSVTGKQEQELRLLDLEGFKVMNEQNEEIGWVKDVISQSFQDLLLIQTGSAEIMIPFVEDYLVSADIDHKEIVLSLPDGLIDLNES